MTSLLDQSALTDLAERLVAAARRAGADAADAVAVRSVSLVGRGARRRGRGIRALRKRRRRPARAGRAPAGGGLDQRHRGRRATPLAERAVAMARVAPEDRLCRPRRSGAARARSIPDLDLLDPELPSVARARGARARGRSGGARGQGRDASRAAPPPRPASAAWCW